MITLSRTELQWLANCVSEARSKSERNARDKDLSYAARALSNLNAENMASLERKLVSARDSAAKRIAIV